MNRLLLIIFIAGIPLIGLGEEPRPAEGDKKGYILLAPTIVGEERGVTVGPGGDLTFGQYLEQIYIAALTIAIIATIVVFVYGGVTYIWPTPGAKSEAKKKMQNALIGLVLALTSWLILNTINPDLTVIDNAIFNDL